MQLNIVEVTEELKRLGNEVTGGFDVRAAACKKLDIRLPIEQCGDTVMLILVDKYGNEKKITIAAPAPGGCSAYTPSLVIKGVS